MGPCRMVNKTTLNLKFLAMCAIINMKKIKQLQNPSMCHVPVVCRSLQSSTPQVTETTLLENQTQMKKCPKTSTWFAGFCFGIK